MYLAFSLHAFGREALLIFLKMPVHMRLLLKLPEAPVIYY